MPTATEYNLPGLERAPRPASLKRPDPCADDRPACPTCSGLQCLCRPRFFPGQLLTDEDLNRLQRYVIDKNRLHARYLHGWGVACGLEVVCDPCASSNVVVRSGYALSPCGDDIVVCKDHSVNVCELIDQCRPQSGVVCDPPYQQAPRECRDGTERWALSICYDERPSRGTTALTGSTDTPCGSSCGCEGSGRCGCQGSSTPSSTGTKKKVYKPQCEPTQICEGYRFVARRLPPETKTKMAAPAAGAAAGNMDLLFAWMYANRAQFGPLIERLLCCVTAALELRTSFNSGQKYPTPGDAVRAYEEYRDALVDFARTFAVHNCAFLDKLTEATQQHDVRMVGVREAGHLNASHEAVVSNAMAQLDTTLFDLIAECFCSALLPACPAPAADNCVPLAVVKVRTRDCRVVEICNWEERKLLISWNTVGYWLSWVPWHKLRENIAKLCCADSPRRGALWPLILVIGLVLSRSRTGKADSDATGGTAGGGPGAGAAPGADAAMRAMRAPGDPFDATLRAGNLVAHLAAGYERLRSGADADAPEWASLIARFADGSALSPLAGREAMRKTELGDLGANLGVDALREEVAGLHKTLAEYKTTMDGLKNLMKGKGA